MSSKHVQFAIGFGLVLVIGLAIIQGCGEITGDFQVNQPPTVEIVNVPEDAYGADTTDHFGMPFTVSALYKPIPILSMAGTSMLPNSETVYGLDPSNPSIRYEFQPDVDYYMAFDTTWTDTLENGTLVEVSAQAALVAIDGDMEVDSTYYIDYSFIVENYYIFTYAPTVHWVGYDPDGFVEYYRYADVIDPEFIANFRDDPGYFWEHQHELTWVDTAAMSARIYLLTSEGDTTEHLFFVKAVDNLNAESQNLVYKTFYRSNNAPNNPQIKTLEAAETEYALNYVVEDTLFCLDEITPLWQGISFNWRGDDPDDKELYQIPLEFSYYLIKTPGDTIWSWSNPDWTEISQIQIFGLETGSYTFSVWVRDDGYTLSDEPATITFKVVKPTFEHHILVVDETANSGVWQAPGDSIAAFYENILYNLEGQLDNDNYVMDGIDVRFLDNSDISPAVSASPIPYSLIGQYKMVLIYDDDHGQAPEGYRNNRNEVLADYLDVGGRVWFTGRMVLVGSFGYSDGDVAIAGTDFLGTYMQLQTGFGGKLEKVMTGDQSIEFIGAVPVLEGYPQLQVDTSHVKMISNNPFMSQPNLMMDVDWFTRSEDAVTLYSFNSITADTVATSPYVYGEDSQVAAGATPTQCVIYPNNTGLLAVYRVAKIVEITPTDTITIEAQVTNFTATEIRVTYPYGQPWSNSDVLLVDYKYDPISEMHLKPVAVRYEAQPRVLNQIEIQGETFTYYTYELGYRTAIFGFPLYFINNDNGEVEEIFREMLNWFFYPTIHWSI